MKPRVIQGYGYLLSIQYWNNIIDPLFLNRTDHISTSVCFGMPSPWKVLEDTRLILIHINQGRNLINEFSFSMKEFDMTAFLLFPETNGSSIYLLLQVPLQFLPIF